MDAIKEILHQRGIDDINYMEVGKHIEIENGEHMPLTIEKIGENRLSVAHYYTQRGDLMSDPEIVFKITEAGWVPVRYTHHPHIHQYNEAGLPKVEDFIQQWDRRLRKQGYTDEAQPQKVDA